MPSHVRIIAPSRIHFGLLSIDKSDDRYFGGAGVMLETPHLELSVAKRKHGSGSNPEAPGASEASTFDGPLAERAQRFLKHWQQQTGVREPVDVQVHSVPPQHVGLGLGTQLGMSVAWALDTLFQRDDVDYLDRAKSVDRGRRSAVGTHGFEFGGLIVDQGKSNDDEIGGLREHIVLPSEWCVVLLRPDGPTGLAGEAEVTAFKSLPPTPPELKQRLRRELYDRLVPSAKSGDFPSFAESVYQFGYAAGEAFAPQQGGPFVSTAVAELVSHLRGMGIPGVGQSSWGPSVYCWFPSRQTAESFAQNVDADPNLPSKVTVSPIANDGARRFIDQA
jgi:beta-RFAP synthase